MSLAEAAKFTNPHEAELAKHRLENEGIPAFTFDTGFNSALGGVSLAPVRLMVDESDLDRARAILAGDDQRPPSSSRT